MSSFIPVPFKTDRQLRNLADDLRSQEAENTHLIPKIEQARALLSGAELDRFNRQYREDYDAMMSNGLQSFGPGALANTLKIVRAILTDNSQRAITLTTRKE